MQLPVVRLLISKLELKTDSMYCPRSLLERLMCVLGISGGGVCPPG
jgi:hypothetical protein